MKATVSLCAAAVLAFSAGSIAFAQSPAPAAPAGPLRHLVYSYTFGVETDLETHASGIGTGGSGIANSEASHQDQGTITVDVLKEDASKGLVVKISENSQTNRTAKPATCVVYGTTATICDPNAVVHPEEVAILRLLGENFVDPAKIDAKQQWSQESTSANGDTKSVFTIAKNDNGVMTINESRTDSDKVGGRDETFRTTATIGYDYPKQVMTSLKQFGQSRQIRGSNQYMTMTTEITAQLQTDSMNKVAHTP